MATNMSRTGGNIVITIRKDTYTPPLPYELQGYVSTETWEFRMRQVRLLCAHYSRPLLERVMFSVAFFVTLILPFILYPIIFAAITPKSLRDQFNNNNSFTTNEQAREQDDAISKYYFEARGIVLGIFIVLVLVMWGPLLAWKKLGSLKARAMTRRWAVEDASRGADFFPQWTIVTPGILTVVGRVLISTPPTSKSQRSSFSASASGELPAYLLQPAQNGAAPAGYFHNPGNGGQIWISPPMGYHSHNPNADAGVHGGYGDEKAGSRAMPMMVDEKYRTGFDEVRV